MLHYRLFSVPVNAPQDEMRELNKFLSGHRIMQVDKTLATDGGSSFYVFCIAYDEKNPQHSASSRNAVDYKEVLNDEDFAVFSKLRELRKECAEHFGRPVYAVFTNEQLAKMVTGKVYKPADMRKIDGIGDSKMADYSKRFLDFLQSVYSLES